MERYSFEEIKNFAVGDIFYSKHKKFCVDSDPTYYNTSEFYGDFSEKVEWTGICETEGGEYRRQHKFIVQNVQSEGEPKEYLIFKTMGE